MDLDSYHLIADWYHSAILEMCTLKDFDPQPQWIARRLGGSVSPASVEAALERLQRLGLLVMRDDGRLVRSDEEHVHVGREIPHAAIRKHHTQMLEKARDAMENQPLQQRHLYGTTLSIRKERYQDAVNLIEQLHHELSRLACESAADQIYHLNTQFFNLTPGNSGNNETSIKQSQ